jgi:hypothetical protein
MIRLRHVGGPARPESGGFYMNLGDRGENDDVRSMSITKHRAVIFGLLEAPPK